MKHLNRISILVIFLLTFIFIISKPTEAAQNITVKINNQSIYFDQYPVIENNRVLVPMRTIFEVMGAAVEWDAKTSTVKAKRGNTYILLPLNSKQATINGEKKSLDVPAKAIKGRTMVPLRFVSESLGCKVEWNGKLFLVSITFDGELKEQTGKVYPDRWVAPLLKSAWSQDPAINFKTLEDELGFGGEGHYYGVQGASRAIMVNEESGSLEVTIVYQGWNSNYIPESYRIPIVAKELFKLYFGADGDRVWHYFNNNDIPEQFTADGRIDVEVDGSVYLEVGRKK